MRRSKDDEDYPKPGMSRMKVELFQQSPHGHTVVELVLHDKTAPKAAPQRVRLEFDHELAGGMHCWFKVIA